MADPPVHRFPGRDGLELVYREIGDGRPLVLLHGFTATALQWVHHGPAATIAEHGYRVILPDLRGHGHSARSHDPVSYPPDALADDGLALIDWLGLEDYDLGGYSLGGRIVLRMLVRGARPARAIVVGQGLDAISRATSRSGRYRRVLTALAHRDTIEPGSPDEETAHWITQLGGDPMALGHVLATLVATPTLVVAGDQDNDQASEGAAAHRIADQRTLEQAAQQHVADRTSSNDTDPQRSDPVTGDVSREHWIVPVYGRGQEDRNLLMQLGNVGIRPLRDAGCVAERPLRYIRAVWECSAYDASETQVRDDRGNHHCH